MVVSYAKKLSYALGLCAHVVYNSIHHGPPTPTCLAVFMVNNLVCQVAKTLIFLVLGAHGIRIFPYRHVRMFAEPLVGSTNHLGSFFLFVSKSMDHFGHQHDP